ncbi:MAG: hypothetical protein FJZ57_05990 [Chlamydiae bacterium]|nr:hypothetical protein [Chlamydiota bacterium]
MQNIFNILLQSKAYAVINFLRWASGMSGVYNVKEDELKKVMRRLLLVNPAVVVETIEAVSEPVIKASELLGIPCLHIATDLDRKCTVRDKPHEYNHFKSCIPYSEDVMTPRVSKTEKPSQIVVVGPPTKRVYDIERSPQQIRDLRKELEKEIKVKIPENKKLIVISTGSNGSYSPYPEFLAEKYAGKSGEEVPFVCVVLCGSNTEYFNHTSKVSSRLPPGVIAPCKLVAPEAVEKLYRVASHGGGVIAKGGGLTVYELSKCVARTIFDNIASRPSIHMGFSGNCLSLLNWIIKNVLRFNDVLPWEKVNQEFAINQGFGASVSTKSDFFREFDKLLASENPVKLKTNVMKFSERLPEVISQAKQAAATDPELIRKRQFVLDPKSAAKVIFN